MDLLNEGERVQRLLRALDSSTQPAVLQPLCQVCHNLLILHKLNSHRQRSVDMDTYQHIRNFWKTLFRWTLFRVLLEWENVFRYEKGFIVITVIVSDIKFYLNTLNKIILKAK